MTEGKIPDNFMTWEHTVPLCGYGVDVSFEAEMPGYRRGEYIHSHSRYEVHIPKHDGLRMVFANETVDLGGNEIMIIAPAVPHTSIPENDSRKGFTYSFREAGAPDFLTPLRFKDDYVIFPNTCAAMEVLLKAERAFRCSDPGTDAQIGCLVASLLIDFVRALTAQNETDVKESAVSAKNAVSIMDSFFTFQYNNRFQKKTLAALLCASERQVERMVYATYGMTFKDKALKTRFEIANYLLKNFGYSIAKTSEIIGYSSEQSFCRAYRKAFGVTPYQYVKSARPKT